MTSKYVDNLQRIEYNIGNKKFKDIDVKSIAKDLLKTYPCPKCKKTFPFDFVLEQHQEMVHKVKVKAPKVKGKFDCKICKEEFEYEHLLYKHHPIAHPLNCDTCFKKYSTKQSLAEHLQIHKSLPKTFECDFPDCSSAFALKRHLSRHQQCHNIARFKCDICGLLLKRVGGLKCHIETVHGKKESADFKCSHPGCKSKFYFPIHLKNHFKKTHQKVYLTLTCDLCSKVFHSKSSMVQHMKIHDPAAKKVKCPDCPLTFISRQYLKYHTVCHLDELPYLCEAGCGARFKRKNAFHSTPVKSECSYCGKIFTHICLLRFHVKSTHLDYLKCQQCGSFLSKTSMSGHLAYHRDQARTKRHYQSYKIQEENKKRDETIEFLKCEVL